jgi:hypothetical protein
VSVEPGRPRARFRREILFAAAAAAALVAILLIWGTLSMLPHRSATRLPTSRQMVPLTSLPGEAVAPTFSTDIWAVALLTCAAERTLISGVRI